VIQLPCTGCDRRAFVRIGAGGAVYAAANCLVPAQRASAEPTTRDTEPDIRAVVRPTTLFAGIRKPITSREQLIPRARILEDLCKGKIAGPLTHIFRFDTPVEGYDSEIGFPVTEGVSTDEVATHTLRRMHFYAKTHEGPIEELSSTTGSLYSYMNTTGLSPELELVETYLDHQPGKQLGGRVDILASFLAWPEVYREQLTRVLGPSAAAAVWKGGETLTPHTLVDPRAAWVGQSLDRLKKSSTQVQQFDVLSRVALIRPTEDVAVYKALYEETGKVEAVFKAQHDKLSQGRTGGFVDPQTFDGRTLHVSKVPYNRKAYDAATTPGERRKAYCFCNLVREAESPRIDPIFCYRAAGWARQFWEPILGVEFAGCKITHSILKGDDYCAWDYRLPPIDASEV